MFLYFCPYCGKRMEEGMIQSSEAIYWHEGSKRYFLNNPRFHEDIVELAGINPFFGSAVRAWYCRDCGKVVIDTKDPNLDLLGPDSDPKPREDDIDYDEEE